MKRKHHSSQQVIRKLGEAKAALASGQQLPAVCQMLALANKLIAAPGSRKNSMATCMQSFEEENTLPGVGSRSWSLICRWTKRFSRRRWALQKISKPDAAAGDRPASPVSSGLFAAIGIVHW